MRTLIKHPIILAGGKEVKRNIVFRSAKDTCGTANIDGKVVSVVLVKRLGKSVGHVK